MPIDIMCSRVRRCFCSNDERLEQKKARSFSPDPISASPGGTDTCGNPIDNHRSTYVSSHCKIRALAGFRKIMVKIEEKTIQLKSTNRLQLIGVLDHISFSFAKNRRSEFSSTRMHHTTYEVSDCLYTYFCYFLITTLRICPTFLERVL